MRPQGDLIVLSGFSFGARVTAAGCAAAVGCLAALASAPGAALGRVMAPAASTSAGTVTAAAAAIAAAKDPHKGVAVWAFGGVASALAKSGAAWYYTWSPSHSGITTPGGTSFVPMIWGAGAVTKSNLADVRREGHYLLGFNEPDNAGQANMPVSQALSLWPQLMATGMTLGSPAVASGTATPGGWLARFMSGAKSRRYRVNFITVHWYGGNFVTASAVSELKSYIQAIYARYHRPIWVTEFALMRFGAATTFPTPNQQAAFVTAATTMLQHLSYVQRYAWFALPASAGDGSAGLFRSGAVATTAGRAFEAVH
jgi:hypothetical protein